MSMPVFNFKGLIVPVFTPFNNDGPRTINVNLIPEYADYLVKKGIKGVLVNGTTGEGPSLSVAERKTITEAWVNVSKKTKLHIMVQVGGAPLPDVIELAKHAESIKVDSILVLPDLYFKPVTPEDLISYLQMVGTAAPKTPMLYYHIPAYTHVNIHMGKCMQTLIRLGNAIPNFVGIKFTSNDLEEGSQALLVANNRYVVFLGSDQLIVPGHVSGIENFIVTSSNLFPKLTLDIIKCIGAGDIIGAKDKQMKLSKAVTLISSYGTWTQTMKIAMNTVTTVNVGPTRVPIIDLPSDKISSLQECLRKLVSEGGYE